MDIRTYMCDIFNTNFICTTFIINQFVRKLESELGIWAIVKIIYFKESQT